MSLLNTLERKLRKYAINDLMKHIVILNCIVFMLYHIDTRGIIINRLHLIPDLVLRGEVWRLITFIFIPPRDTLMVIILLYFYYMIGSGLENAWGSVRFNLYYLIGIIGAIISTFITGGIIGSTAPIYINLSLVLAFAKIYPNFEILLFFILPVKMKYLAWFSWFWIGYILLIYPFDYKFVAIASVLNYFIFFGKDILRDLKRRKRRYEFKKNIK